MALASKEQLQNESAMAIIQASAFYDQGFGGGPTLLHTSSHSSPYALSDSPEKAPRNFTMSNSSSASSPSSTNSNGIGFQPGPESNSNSNSVITFKPELQGGNFNIHANAGSLLSFDQTSKRVLLRNLNPKMMIGEEEDEYPMWEQPDHDDDHHGHLHYQSHEMNINNHGMPETSSSHHTVAEPWAWLNEQEPSGVTDGVHEEMEAVNNKRQSMGENPQAMKKQCGVGSKKPKPKSVAQSKDPQSVAAKNRRERISERLKTLQELVPNGSKVDLVTMLEKAISYVKFLQLQVKVLAADEFWPAQGGKAPDLSQVREAIDAILASQRDRSSSSK